MEESNVSCLFLAIARQSLLDRKIEVIAVNHIVPADNLAYLLKYGSTQGKFAGTVMSKNPTGHSQKVTRWSRTTRRSNVSRCAKVPLHFLGRSSASRS